MALIRALRSRQVKTAIVSSSKNCVPVLKTAGLLDLFDAKVDGVDSERLALKGKPEPDIFLEAARQLGVEPACAIVVEDAIAGVQAGSAGKFGLVIGVDRANQAEALRSNGADLVVDDLEEIALRAASPIETEAKILPSALVCMRDINDLAIRKRLVVFLDYDGTLTPIVARPEDAVLSEAMRGSVRALAASVPLRLSVGGACATCVRWSESKTSSTPGATVSKSRARQAGASTTSRERAFLPELDRGAARTRGCAGRVLRRAGRAEEILGRGALPQCSARTGR